MEDLLANNGLRHALQLQHAVCNLLELGRDVKNKLQSHNPEPWNPLEGLAARLHHVKEFETKYAESVGQLCKVVRDGADAISKAIPLLQRSPNTQKFGWCESPWMTGAMLEYAVWLCEIIASRGENNFQEVFRFGHAPEQLEWQIRWEFQSALAQNSAPPEAKESSPRSPDKPRKLSAHQKALLLHEWACEQMELNPEKTPDDKTWQYLKDNGLPDIPGLLNLKKVWPLQLQTYKQYLSRARTERGENKHRSRQKN